jgi:hypothetical protein
MKESSNENNEEYLQAFLLEREQFHGLCDPILFANSGTRGAPRPSQALAFAKELILCLEVRQAPDLVLRDPQGARAFTCFADQVSGAVSTALGDELLAKYRAKGTPFFVLTAVVIDFLEMNRRDRPEEWD